MAPPPGSVRRHPVRARHLQPQHEPAVLDHGPAVVVPVVVLAGDEPVDLDHLDRVVGRRRRDLREGDLASRTTSDHPSGLETISEARGSRRRLRTLARPSVTEARTRSRSGSKV